MKPQYLAIFLAASAITAAEPSAPTITVVGEGVGSVEIQEARVTLGVSHLAPTAKQAEAEVAKDLSAIVNVLQKGRRLHIETGKISLRPMRNGEKRESYLASATVHFWTDTNSTSELISLALRNGANEIERVLFLPGKEQKQQAEAKALREACENGMQQAKIVAEALGVRTGRIQQVTVQPPYTPMPAARFSAEKLGSELPVLPGEQEVKASVNISVEIE